MALEAHRSKEFDSQDLQEESEVEEGFYQEEPLEKNEEKIEEVHSQLRNPRTIKETASKTRIETTKKGDGVPPESILPSYDGSRPDQLNGEPANRRRLNPADKSKTRYIGSVQSIDFGLPRLVRNAILIQFIELDID